MDGLFWWPAGTAHVQQGCCHPGHVPSAPWRGATSSCASLLHMGSGGPGPDAPAVNGVAGWIPFGSEVGGAVRRVPLNGVPLMFSFFPRDFPVKLRGAFRGASPKAPLKIKGWNYGRKLRALEIKGGSEGRALWPGKVTGGDYGRFLHREIGLAKHRKTQTYVRREAVLASRTATWLMQWTVRWRKGIVFFRHLTCELRVCVTVCVCK